MEIVVVYRILLFNMQVIRLNLGVLGLTLNKDGSKKDGVSLIKIIEKTIYNRKS